MPLLLVLVLGSVVFALVAFVAWRYPTPLAEPTPSLAAAQAIGTEIGHHGRLRRTIKSRLNPEAATGLALTIGLAAIVVGGLVLGVLAFLVRSNSSLLHFDASVAKWGNEHSGPVSDRGLNIVTQLGGVWLVTLLAVVVAIVGYVRRPNRWIPVFLLTVLVGEVLLSNAIKQLLDRVRPTFNPIAAHLGPSFPSGHSTAAAAFYAAAALILGRGASPKARALLAGGAAGIAVAVATTRVMLDVHWVSDVIAGLALGWAWFAICSIAFGGRMLSFGGPAKKAMQEADAEARSPNRRARSLNREPALRNRC
jgi:membrane-associated phospholipid phosphatase